MCCATSRGRRLRDRARAACMTRSPVATHTLLKVTPPLTPVKCAAMRNAALLFSLLAVPLAVWPAAAVAKTPVVVELYTAQGCGACGEANAYAVSYTHLRAHETG